VIERLYSWLGNHDAGEREAAYFVAISPTSVLNLAFMLAMWPLLGADEFGLFAALFGLVAFATAIGDCLRIVVARRIAELQQYDDRDASTRELLSACRPALFATISVVGVGLTATPVLKSALGAPAGPILWTVAACGLSTLIPAMYGALQGMRQSGLLVQNQMVVTGTRFALGLALVLTGFGPSGAMAAVVISFVPSLLLTALVLVQDVDEGERLRRPRPLPSNSLAAMVVVALVVAVPGGLDLALARHLLAAEGAGQYAIVAVFGKGLLLAGIATMYVAIANGLLDRGGKKDSQDVLWVTLRQTATYTAGGAFGLLALAAALNRLAPGSIVASEGALFWYLLAMGALSLTVTWAYHEISRGLIRPVLGALGAAALLPVLGVLVFHGSPAGMARVIFLANAVVLAGSLAPVVHPMLQLSETWDRIRRELQRPSGA